MSNTIPITFVENVCCARLLATGSTIIQAKNMLLNQYYMSQQCIVDDDDDDEKECLEGKITTSRSR